MKKEKISFFSLVFSLYLYLIWEKSIKITMFNLYIMNEIYTNGFLYNSLNIMSITSILCGVSVITAKNPIVSVLFLIGLFFSIASYLMILGLNFIGLSYLLVYVGAVSILFLFILMLINVRISELVTNNSNSVILAFIIGVLLFIPIYSKGNIINNVKFDESTISIYATYNGYMGNITQLFNNVSFTDNLFLVTSEIWDGIIGEMPHITNIGAIIYSNYPLWLILTSVILLLAMVGAIIITIKQ